MADAPTGVPGDGRGAHPSTVCKLLILSPMPRLPRQIGRILVVSDERQNPCSMN